MTTYVNRVTLYIDAADETERDTMFAEVQFEIEQHFARDVTIILPDEPSESWYDTDKVPPSAHQQWLNTHRHQKTEIS